MKLRRINSINVIDFTLSNIYGIVIWMLLIAGGSYTLSPTPVWLITYVVIVTIMIGDLFSFPAFREFRHVLLLKQEEKVHPTHEFCKEKKIPFTYKELSYSNHEFRFAYAEDLILAKMKI